MERGWDGRGRGMRGGKGGRKRWGSKGRRKKDIAEWGRKRKLRSEEEGKLEGGLRKIQGRGEGEQSG